MLKLVFQLPGYVLTHLSMLCLKLSKLTIFFYAMRLFGFKNTFESLGKGPEK